jgi:hypothetical protein
MTGLTQSTISPVPARAARGAKPALWQAAVICPQGPFCRAGGAAKVPATPAASNKPMAPIGISIWRILITPA